MSIKLKIKKLYDIAELPSYSTTGSACFDIKTIESGYVDPGQSLSFKTGLSFEIPEDHAMLVYSRSGNGFKNGIRLSNAVGIIDSDYRGELVVKLHNDSKESFHVNNGDRIAQAKLLFVPKCEIIEVDQLSSTDRGIGGFGSTGVA